MMEFESHESKASAILRFLGDSRREDDLVEEQHPQHLVIVGKGSSGKDNTLGNALDEYLTLYCGASAKDVI